MGPFERIQSLEQLISSGPGGLGDRAVCCPETSPPARVSEAAVSGSGGSLPAVSQEGQQAPVEVLLAGPPSNQYAKATSSHASGKQIPRLLG